MQYDADNNWKVLLVIRKVQIQTSMNQGNWEQSIQRP